MNSPNAQNQLAPHLLFDYSGKDELLGNHQLKKRGNEHSRLIARTYQFRISLKNSSPT